MKSQIPRQSQVRLIIMLNIQLQVLSKRKKRKSKIVKKASNSGVSDTPAEPGEADNYVEHPTSDGEQKNETKKRKSKLLNRLHLLRK